MAQPDSMSAERPVWGGVGVGEWVVVLPLAERAAVMDLRLELGVLVAESATEIWLRGEEADPALRDRLLTLPARARYVPLADGALRAWGDRLESARLPELTWQPLRAWARVEFPVAAVSGALLMPEELRLVAGDRASTGGINAVRVSLADWLPWALAAPAIRLRELRMAVNESGVALVLGLPLPSVPGRHFCAHDGVILPAGRVCEPAVGATVLRRICGAKEGDWVLWDEAGFQVLNRELFVPVTRASIRATGAALAD